MKRLLAGLLLAALLGTAVIVALNLRDEERDAAGASASPSPDAELVERDTSGEGTAEGCRIRRDSQADQRSRTARTQHSREYQRAAGQHRGPAKS